ncbi:hypothetical protein [Xylanibacillus composti]|uniref:Uncharacterized protein n=1 Tax=Xylanibacillus composti TaxID=1572762 RepID=A0A8J4H1G9_9BACL|nr:hypothetical protein [Xylanibacillus composti]GIQ69197.1 hypothetical protein XYCOK13_20210 [Xylanibacillus composti]
MTQGRSMQELQTVSLQEWEREELARQHEIFSDLSPWLNAQGNAIHHQIIEEIERRGGI